MSLYATNHAIILAEAPCPSSYSHRPQVSPEVTQTVRVTQKNTSFAYSCPQLDAFLNLCRFNGMSVTGAEDDRTVYSCFGTMVWTVDLHQYNILARFQAKGQINRVPGVWDPEWEAAEVCAA